MGDGLARRSLREAVASGAALVLGWGLAVGAYYLVFLLLGADFGRALGHTFAGPALRNALAGHLAYPGGLRSFLGQMLARDLGLYLLCAAGLLLRARHFLGMGRAERRAWIFTLVITALVFAHRAPWPYNFVMAIPFLGLWGAVPVRAMPAGRPRARFALGAAVATVMALSFVRNVHYLDHDNRVQTETMRRAEALLGPGDGYADGIRMLATRRDVVPRWWDRATIADIRAAAEAGDMSHFERIFAGAPKVWILSYRTRALGEFLRPYLDNAYVPIFPNILIAGAELAPGREVTFEARWPGAYRLYRADGTPAEARLVVDGARAAAPVNLPVGPHALRLGPAPGPLYLLPADIDIPFDLSAPREPRVLFDRVYTF